MIRSKDTPLWRSWPELVNSPLVHVLEFSHTMAGHRLQASYLYNRSGSPNAIHLVLCVAVRIPELNPEPLGRPEFCEFVAFHYGLHTAIVGIQSGILVLPRVVQARVKVGRHSRRFAWRVLRIHVLRSTPLDPQENNSQHHHP